MRMCRTARKRSHLYFSMFPLLSFDPPHNLGYFCATNFLAWLNSGRVEFDPPQTFSNVA
jgi:hypothetical protein